jgi:hypothetical protein
MYTLAWLRVGGLETHTHTEKGRKVNVDGWLVKIAFLFHKKKKIKKKKKKKKKKKFKFF